VPLVGQIPATAQAAPGRPRPRQNARACYREARLRYRCAHPRAFGSQPIAI